MNQIVIPAVPVDAAARAAETRDAALRKQASQLEAFLFAELLRVSGTGRAQSFTGRESQFDSFLRQAQADEVAATGQAGLADAIYGSMRQSLG